MCILKDIDLRGERLTIRHSFLTRTSASSSRACSRTRGLDQESHVVFM